ncbi:hypothetical protein BHM03_00047100, partial [Ensete ventricosum]
MLPLRFPNSGIRVKVFVRKVDFKQCSEEEARPATVSPHARPATHGQAAARATRKGQQPVGATLAGTAGRDQLSGAAAAGSAVLARGCRPRPALPPAGAMAPVVGVDAPWQGQRRRRGDKGKFS